MIVNLLGKAGCLLCGLKEERELLQEKTERHKINICMEY